MGFEEAIIGALIGLYALVVTLYYRIGKLEQRLRDLIAYYLDGKTDRNKYKL